MTDYDLAACQAHDPELWFPVATSEAPFAPLSAPGTARAALDVCWSCPVVSGCLRDALAARTPYGVLGGATAHERGQMLRSNRNREEVMPDAELSFT